MKEQKPCNCVKAPCNCGDTTTTDSNPSVLYQKKKEGLNDVQKWGIIIGVTAFIYYILYKVNKL